MNWYKRFLSYFIQIYEVTAANYVEIDSIWCLEEKTIEEYIHSGNIMLDIVIV